SRECVYLAGVWYQIALLAGVTKERHRGFGIDQNQMIELRQLQGGQFRQIGNTFNRWQSRTPLDTGREGFSKQGDTVVGSNAGRCNQARFSQRLATKQQCCFLAGAHGLGSGLNGGVIGRRRFRSEEHTSELQSRENLVCRLLLEKKN